MTSIESIIDRQLRRWEIERQKKLEATTEGKKLESKPVITVSRQRGSRGSYLAERLAESLSYQLLHREIIDRICNSSGYRRQVIESLDDKTRSNIELWFEGMIKGQYVDASNYFRYLLKVIRSISAQSGVVIVGRGANFIMPFNTGFHLRVIADINTRINNLVRFQNMTRQGAEAAIRKADEERSEFIRNGFRRDINDPSAYDMIINTTSIGIEDVLGLARVGFESKIRAMNTPK